MLLTTSVPRGGTIAIGAFLVVFIFILYKFDVNPIHRAEPPSPDAPPPRQYLPTPTAKPLIQVNFPAAAQATAASDIPPIPSFNQPKLTESDAPAPLFIGFTRNWAILQQAVVSYLAAGWPADQIYVVENTGTMYANKLGQLTLQNPFYLNYSRLTNVYGVNVLTTPSLFTFAQLQNFMTFTSVEKGWKNYFWSHMDVAVLGDERFTIADKDDPNTGRYASLFRRALDKRDELVRWENGDPNASQEFKDSNGKWSVQYFAYDRLTLVNTQSYVDVGGWDPMIGYYLGDCDFYDRLRMASYYMATSDIGMIADVGTTVPDLAIFYRRKGWDSASETANRNFGAQDERGGEGYEELHKIIRDLEERKLRDGPGLRNFWQSQQQGGQGEPFYKDSDGFERGLWMMIENGRAVFAEKWGHRDCDIRAQGLVASDAWRVKHDGDW